jgi:hypothetical protein
MSRTQKLRTVVNVAVGYGLEGGLYLLGQHDGFNGNLHGLGRAMLFYTVALFGYAFISITGGRD